MLTDNRTIYINESETNNKIDDLLQNIWVKFIKNNFTIISFFAALLGTIFSFLIQLLSYLWYYTYAVYYKIDLNYMHINNKTIINSLFIIIIISITLGYPSYYSARNYFYKSKKKKNKIIKNLTISYLIDRIFSFAVCIAVLPFIPYIPRVKTFFVKYDLKILFVIVTIIIPTLLIIILIFNLYGLTLFFCTKEYANIVENKKSKKKNLTIGKCLFAICIFILYFGAICMGNSYSNAKSQTNFDIVYEDLLKMQNSENNFAVLSNKEDSLYVVRCSEKSENGEKTLVLYLDYHKLIPADNILLKSTKYDKIQLK